MTAYKSIFAANDGSKEEEMAVMLSNIEEKQKNVVQMRGKLNDIKSQITEIVTKVDEKEVILNKKR